MAAMIISDNHLTLITWRAILLDGSIKGFDESTRVFFCSAWDKWLSYLQRERVFKIVYLSVDMIMPKVLTLFRC